MSVNDYTIEHRQILHSPMEVFLFWPANNTTTDPLPGIVLAQHIPIGHTGVENDTFTIETAKRLAAQGVAVAVPFIFHWWPKEAGIEIKRAESRDDWMSADMQGAFDLLASHSRVDEARIGVAGHCWGGRVAWLAACHNPKIRSCAMFYGGRIKIAMGDGNPPPIELAGKIQCEVTGFFGNDDENPSPSDVNDYSNALHAAGVTHEFHRYDGAGHAFQNFPNPEKYRETASEDAWNKVIAFFKRTL